MIQCVSFHSNDSDERISHMKRCIFKYAARVFAGGDKIENMSKCEDP